MPNYMSKEAIMKRLQEHYDYATSIIEQTSRVNPNKASEPFVIFLQGSQNYITRAYHESSDIDSRVITIPGLAALSLGEDFSLGERLTTFEEHVEIFDLRKYRKLLRSPGINNYEGLFSEYVIVNPKYQRLYDKLVDMRESIVREDEKGFLMATMGISMRDLKTLQSRIGNQDRDIEKYGYSRKRLSNIIRFRHTAEAYLEGKPFQECLRAMDEHEIKRIRRTPSVPSLENARKIATEEDARTAKIAKEFQRKESDESSVREMLDELIVEIIKEKVKSDLK